MAVTRQAIREKIVDRLYAGKAIVRSTTTTVGTTSTLIDTQLISGMFQATDFIGAYVLMSGGKTDSTSLTDEDPFAAADVTLTVDDGTDFAVGQFIVIDTEWLEITGIASNDLTVVRGILGTTDASHANNSIIYISTDMQSSKIIAYDRATGGTFTFSPVFRSAVDTANTATYEIHYDLHPFRVNEAITYSIEVGTRNALTAPDTDAETTTLDVETVVEGGLAYCKNAIADQTEARDPAASHSDIDIQELRRQAVIHEANWLRGLGLAGYRPAIVPMRTQQEGEGEAQ